MSDSESGLIRIGFPRALLYHKYATLWTTFFRALGCQTVTSPETNRQILEQGLQYSIDETCLAVKIYMGHIRYLLDRADYLFIPRFVSLYPTEEACVKLFALADIVRNTFETARIIEYTVDIDNRQYEVVGMVKAGLQLCHNPVKVFRAYRQAAHEQAKHKQALLEKQLRHLAAPRGDKLRVLLVAHAYVNHDALLGKTVVRLLNELGVEPVFADIVDEHTARALSTQLSRDVHWTYSKELLGAIECYRPYVDGVIFLMAFPCGPDSLVVSLCQHRITDLPVCTLVMDELQGDAGIKTRLESFIDILQFRKEKQL